MRTRFLSASALFLLCAHARASGFHIDEQDARATGRGGAVTANPSTAAAIYYNPGGVGELEGLHINAGASAVGPSSSFRAARDGAQTSASSDVFFLPQLYASYRIGEAVGVGVGMNSPFGLSLSWPASSPGRGIVRDIALKTFFITPTIGLNFSRRIPGLSFGAGLDLVPASVKLVRDVPFGTDVGSAAIGATAFGVGARAGILYRPKGLEQWSFGLTYRSPVKLSFSGTADFDAPPAYRASLPPDGPATTSVVLPQTLDLGIAVDPVPGWEIELDGNWLGWSSFDELALHVPGNQTIDLKRDWRNTFAVRLGTEFTIHEWWSARFGVIWDQGPVPDTTIDFQLPDVDRVDFSTGIGAAFTRVVRADLGALYVLPGKKSTSNADPYRPPIKGQYSVRAWVVNLSVGITLDPKRRESTAAARTAAGDRTN